MSSPATKKLKQASLMSFFGKRPLKTSSPVKQPQLAENTPLVSSPIKKQESAPKESENNTLVATPEVKEESKEETKIRDVPSSPVIAGGRKRINYAEDSSDNEDDETPIVNKKRKRVKVDDDDDDVDGDFKMPSDAEQDDDNMDDSKMSLKDELTDLHDTTTINEDDTTMDDTVNSSFTAKIAKKANKKSTSQSSIFPRSKKPSPSALSSSLTPQKKFDKENEERYHWLVNVKDADQRTQDDPEYDQRTLYIPKSAWDKFTAFEKQYWTVKAKMWDTIVFFKKGKFYELYENDADIAHQQFDLKLAGTGRANMRLAGVPEMSFDFWAKRFIDSGYKVAKVDQKETALGKEIRAKNGTKSTKETKVIQRDLSYVLTCGTLTDESLISDEMSKYCLSVKELIDTNDNSRTFGVCFVDVSTGRMYIIQFDDDYECSKFETLISQVQPMEILLEKNGLSQHALKILRFNSNPNASFNFLKPNTEFWDFETTFDELNRGAYFEDISELPTVLKSYYEKEKTTAFSSFGALLWYLKSLKLDKNVITMKNVEEYDPFNPNLLKTSMRLDGTTLQNLEIFSNTFDKSDRGSLFRILNKGLTPFGKRLFKNWVLHPLLDKTAIEKRYDSVELILNDGDLKYILESHLGKLADVERMLARIHSGTLRPKEFVKVIKSFQTTRSLISKLNEYGLDNLKGALNKLIVDFPEDELSNLLNVWEDAFNEDLATNENIIVPNPGVEPEYDQSNEKIKDFEDKLAEIIKEYQKEYSCKDIVFRDNGKELYLIEVPVKFVSKIPIDWIQKGSTAKYKRYWSPVVKDLVKDYMIAKELHSILCGQLQQKIYAKFDLHYNYCLKIVKAIGEIDCLLSLARGSESMGFPLCRPEIIERNYSSIEFKQLRHPCFIPGSGISSTQDYIPNDISLGVDNQNNIGLLTGANAAGKSTLLRMTCVATIMAQIGCFVPAESAKITPVDAIMTRLGANDNIMQGKSTFYVELLETKRMLDSSTPKSLIVLDELGRGGSSSDGFAIAESVLHHFGTHIQSIGFFATHYANLGDSFINHPKIKPMRMSILVDDKSKKITFLYKLEEGKSNGSFGMHVATMCGINPDVVKNAEIAANDWEHTAKLTQLNNDHGDGVIPLGIQSDCSWIIQGKDIGETVAGNYNEFVKKEALKSILSMI